MNILYVGIGGAIGAALRFLISEFSFIDGQFPVATLCINLLGSFLLSYFLTNTTLLPNLHIKLALTTGVLGAFTTFSSFSFETLQLFQNGLLHVAILYIGISLIGGLLCSVAGFLLARRLEV